MKKRFFLLVIGLLLLCSACAPNNELSNTSVQDESLLIEESLELSADVLATEKWENTFKKNGNIILQKFTKEYDGDTDNFSITALEYTNGEFTGKIITVYTDGKKSHDEEYEYDGEILLYCRKTDYSRDTSASVFSYVYSVDKNDSEYAYCEGKEYYSEEGTLSNSDWVYYNDDTSVLKTEQVTQKEIEGYLCQYYVITEYENGTVTSITHRAFDNIKLEYYYEEKRSSEDIVIYTKTNLNNITTYTFPNIGGYIIKENEFEFFGPEKGFVAKARFENGMLTIYETANNISQQDALNKVKQIASKAKDYGLE